MGKINFFIIFSSVAAVANSKPSGKVSFSGWNNSFTMSSDSDRLQFRLQHIIPRSFSYEEVRKRRIFEGPKPQSPNEPQEIYFQMTFGKIAGKVWGPPDGRPVLAIHGWLDNAGSYDRLIPLLPKDLRIVVVEIPGHGLSDSFPPDIAFNSLDAPVAIDRIRKMLKWDKFYFLVHSLGAAFAMTYSGMFPERVEKLVMLDLARVPVTDPERVHLRLRKTAEKLLKYEEATIAGPEKPISYEAAVQKGIEGSFGSLDEEACHVMFKRGLKKVEGGYVFCRDRRLMTAPLGFWPKEDQLALARNVTADVLFIKYKDGPEFEPMDEFMEHVEAIKAKSKDVRFVEVEGKHHTHLTHPELVAPIVSDFFGSC